MELGERIKEARLRAHLSQEKVAERIGVSRQAVTKWESGQSAPNTENLFKLAEILGTTVDILIAPEDNAASVAEQVYRMIREEEGRKEAARQLQKQKNIRAFLLIPGCYLLIYLTGKFLCWDRSQMALFPWIIDLDSTQHSYLFGWLLTSNLFHISMLISALTALGGWRKFSITSLAGFTAGLLVGEFLGDLPRIVAPGYHYGWVIWGGIFLGSWAMGLWLQKMTVVSFHEQKFRLWILVFLGIMAAVTIYTLLSVPPYARA